VRLDAKALLDDAREHPVELAEHPGLVELGGRSIVATMSNRSESIQAGPPTTSRGSNGNRE
jgi:hypothetical protein